MGGKSGGSSHTPVEAKETGRSFQILRILEIISEGEIYGLVDDMKSVYLDKTPLANADGSFNFKNVEVYANAGTQSQTPLIEFNSVEKEIEVGSKVLYEKPIIKTVTNPDVNRIRMTIGTERLMRTEDNGDINPNQVSMQITILKNNDVYSVTPYEFNGKYSNPYREMFTIENLPSVPFQIKVERLTEESTSNKIFDNVFWGSYTEIIDEEFAYPNTALVGLKIDSEYFSKAPVRNYEIYGLIVKIPNIYDSFNHRYTSDFWNGEFKLGWTNNPAWIFYDLVTNTRYGMGQSLSDFQIDKWQLFAIGKYCDEQVDNGYGEFEPRMTCNIWLTDQRKAYDLIMDLTSVFRGMPVWNGQSLTAIQDRASDPVWTYNNSNVIGGFSRQRSARKARHNTIHVQYIDKDDFYEKKIECVTDDKLVARFGEVVKKVTAFGCTSRGQAYRTGKWLLETEKLETETITFTVGQEGVMHLPYDIIEIADNDYAGTNIGGRILNVNIDKITLDRKIEIDNDSYLSYISAKGKTEQVRILSFNNETNVATVANDLTGTPEYSMWALSTQRIVTGLYRAISIKENDKSNEKTYTITAVQHVPEKEDIVTNGTNFEQKPKTLYGEVIDVNVDYDGKQITFTGKVNNTTNPLLSKTITSYTIKVLKNNALLYIKRDLSTPDLNLDDLENGEYQVVIHSYNEQGQLLNTITKSFVIDRPPLVQDIKLTSHIASVWLSWAYVNEITQTEIWVNTVDDLKTAKLLATVSSINYTHNVGGKQTRYYWFRHKRGINFGLFDQIQGRVITSGIDLDERLKELDKELSKNVVNEIINTALPARKLEMVLTVENIEDPTIFKNHKQLYNEADGKIWVWDKIQQRYTPDSTEVLASAIQGIIQPNQLANIPTTKLSGTITNEMLQSISTNKLAGVLNINQLPSIPTTKLQGVISEKQIKALKATKLIGTIPINLVPNIPTTKLTGVLTDEQIQTLNATKLRGSVPLNNLPSIPTTQITGSFNDSQIQGISASKITGTINVNQLANIPTTKLTGTISANQLSANSVGANIIQSNAISSQHIQANSINSAKILANAIATNHIQSNAINSDKILANSVIARHIATNAISSDKILANAITSDKINANAITAREIASNAVTSDKILANAISANKIASNAIEARHIKANAISANAIQAGIIGTNHIASNSINASKMQANSIASNAIQTNAITSDKIQANAITSAKIQAGVINTNHLHAGAISTEKLAIGLGGNLLYNPIFAHIENNAPDGWAFYTSESGASCVANTDVNFGLRTMALPNENCARLYRDRASTTAYCQITQRVAVNRNSYYMASAYVGNHRGVKTELIIQYVNKNNQAISEVSTQGGNGFTGLETATRLKLKFRTPADCESVTFYLRLTGITQGQRNSLMLIARPMLEECTQYTTEPSTWVNAGVTAIHGGSIKAQTITAQQLKAGSITAREIASNAITANHISARAITSDKIATGAIKASQIQVTSLSAINSNLGDITAGSINIGNSNFTVSNNGIVTAKGGVFNGTINASDINGGIIRGARFIGATGDFTGTITVASTLGAEVARYRQQTNFTKFKTIQTSHEHCYDDSNNSTREICDSHDQYLITYKSTNTFSIPARSDETILSDPNIGKIISVTPTMQQLLGSSGRVVRSNTTYTVKVEVEEVITAGKFRRHRPPSNIEVFLRRNKRF